MGQKRPFSCSRRPRLLLSFYYCGKESWHFGRALPLVAKQSHLVHGNFLLCCLPMYEAAMQWCYHAPLCTQKRPIIYAKETYWYTCTPITYAKETYWHTCTPIIYAKETYWYTCTPTCTPERSHLLHCLLPCASDVWV